MLCYSPVPTVVSFPNCLNLHFNGRGEGEISYASNEWSQLAVSASLSFFHVAVQPDLSDAVKSVI